jgi:archaellum component FlaC
MEMKKKMDSRRRDFREKMEKARAEKGGQPGDADQLRQAMERFREEGRKRMEEAKTKMEEARKRFREMEQRLERLEGEVARMKEAAEKSD